MGFAINIARYLPLKTRTTPTDLSMKKLLQPSAFACALIVSFACLEQQTEAQIALTGSPYTENFDSLGATGTTTPAGWFVGTGTAAISSTSVAVDNGGNNTGGNKSFGTTSAT